MVLCLLVGVVLFRVVFVDFDASTLLLLSSLPFEVADVVLLGVLAEDAAPSSSVDVLAFFDPLLVLGFPPCVAAPCVLTSSREIDFLRDDVGVVPNKSPDFSRLIFESLLSTDNRVVDRLCSSPLRLPEDNSFLAFVALTP